MGPDITRCDRGTALLTSRSTTRNDRPSQGCQDTGGFPPVTEVPIQPGPSTSPEMGRSVLLPEKYARGHRHGYK